MRTTIINIIAILSFFISKELNAQSVITLTVPFDASGGVSIDAAGVIYVANFGDALNNANGTIVYKVTDDGGVSAWASGLFGASGNEFDSQGNLFQSNIAANRISKITPDGTVSTFTTTNILGPVGVTVDNLDNVYTTNCNAPGAIIKTTPAGVSTIFAQSSLFNCPNGLTMDNDGNFYSVNFSNGSLLKITPNGDVSILATMPGGNNGHVTFGNGRLYVVDRGANQIYEVSLIGAVKLLAGTGAAGNSDDRDALQSTWFASNGIKLSSSGNELYINDKVPNTGTQLNPVIVRMIAGIGDIPPGYLAAGMNVDVRSGEPPLTVQFSDISFTDSESPISSWSWDFDNDGNEDSDEENPTWTYSNSDTYTVSLTVTNDSTSKTRVRRDFIEVAVPVAIIDSDGENIPNRYNLKQNYPNPFNPETTISYSLPNSGRVLLTIINVHGREVARITDGVESAGIHNVIWDASDYVSGIYFYRLQAGDFVQTRKMILLK